MKLIFVCRVPEGWWEPLRTEENKDTPPPELVMYDEYMFQYMGVENEDEALGRVKSGESNTSNIFSGKNGEIGLGEADTEADYREFTLCFPTIKFPGSYGFVITFWNGISE